MASSLPGFLSFLFPPKSSPTAISTSPPSSSRPQLPLSKPFPGFPQDRDRDRDRDSSLSLSSDDFDISAVICPSLAHSNTLFFSSSLSQTKMTAIPRSSSRDRTLPIPKPQLKNAFLQSNPSERPKPKLG